MTRRWAGAVLAPLVLLVISLVAGSAPYRALGIGDPGVVVRVVAPLLRLAADSTATVCVGALTFAVFFGGMQDSGVVSAPGYAALRSSGRWATVWACVVAMLLPFDVATMTGRFADGASIGLWAALEEPVGWLLTMVLAVVVSVACRFVLRWQTSVAVMVVALLALLPPLVTGHAGSDAGHDLSTAAVVLHVPAAVVWFGAALALAKPSWRRGLPSRILLQRYRKLAVCCMVVVTGSSLVETLVLVPPNFGSGYGLVAAAKVLVVAALALGYWRTRAASVSWNRFAATEITALAVTFALSVGLTQQVPPALLNDLANAQRTLLGYDLGGAPTPPRLLLDWRVDVFFLPFAAALFAVYLVGVRRVRASGGRWPIARTAAWSAGCLVLVAATCSGIGRYSGAMFSVHITAHMAISMVAPMLLALGGPGTLADLALRPSEVAGPREWLRALRGSRAIRVCTHPVPALTLFAGAPFLLYFTGLFDAAVRFHWAHMLIDVVFLAIGYLFAWPVLGVDATPRPLPNLARLGMVLAAMPFDIVFGAALLSSGTPIGNGPGSGNMYAALNLPWVHGLLTDQRVAGVVALVIGELTLLVAIAVLLARWRGVDEETGLDELLSARVLAERPQPQTVRHHQQ